MEEENFEIQVLSDSENYIQDFQISSNEKFNGQRKFKNVKLMENVKTYFSKPDKYKQDSFIQLFGLHCKNPQNKKSICAKSVVPGQTIAQCYNCRTDSSCIICMDCYKNGNHEGHKVIFKKAYGGCCDCGDQQAWKKQGFCKNHTGESVEIQIDDKDIQHFVSVFNELFYLYFRQNLMGNANNFVKYGQSLIQNLQFINSLGIYYNKLTWILFKSPLPQSLKLSQNADKRTILQNILCPITSGVIGKQWMDLFISMFPYYKFKQLLLKTYIKSYSLIYNASEQSQNNGTSISCQLMTSYQLVRDYALEQGSIPIGNDIQPKNLKELEKIIYNVIHDLNYTCKLQGDAPVVYWRFHIKDNFLKIFQFVKLIQKEQEKAPQDSNILKLAKYVKYFQIQYLILQCMSLVASTIKNDKQLLQMAIKILYDASANAQVSESMVIFRPIQRTLCLFLFTYADLDLYNILSQNFSQNLIQKVLKTDKQSFSLKINKMLKSFLKTYLFYSKILSQPGLNTTLYPYVYFYRTKNRFVSALDVVWIKYLTLIKQSEPVLTIKNYIDNTENQINKGQSSHFILLLTELNVAVASKSCQIYLAYKIDSTCTLYAFQIQQILKRILNGQSQKSFFTIQTLKQYQQIFFHSNVNLIGHYMKKLCDFDKLKKAFILKKQFEGALSLNYKDFRCNLTNKEQFQHPQKTLYFIQKSYNVQIHQKIWSIETIKKTIIFGIQIIKTFLNKNQQIEHIKVILSQLCKILYQKRRLARNAQTKDQLDIVLRLIKKVQGIEPLFSNFYIRQFYPEKMQIQQQPKNNQEAQKQRKRILKEKMEIKKKMIKQKYNQQSQNFVGIQSQKSKKVQYQSMHVQNEHKCIICRHQNPTDVIYLVNFSYKNHEKLLGMGEGVLTLSIQSCFHVLDYTCYKKMAQKISKLKPNLKCPFCKFSANTFLPADPKSQHLNQAIKNCQMTIFTLKNFDEICMVEQLIKSFYHYALLSILDPQRTISKRARIYKLILQMLKNNKEYFSALQNCYNNFVNKTMNLNPKQFKNYKKMDINRRQTLVTFFQNTLLSGEDQIFDNIDAQDYDILMSHYENPQSEQSQGFFGKLNQFKQKLIKKKSQKTEVKQAPNIFTPIMKKTMEIVFSYLGVSNQNKEQINEQLNPYVVYCMNQLLQNEISNLAIMSNKSEENNSLLKLRQLPVKYLPLSKFSKCDTCQQLSSSLCICLLCDWKGCLKNCMHNKKQQVKGGCFAHSIQHGEHSLFLSILKCEVYMLNGETGHIMGVIYKDEWGNNFQVKKDWDQFFLDQFLLQKIKISFLHDQQIS